VNAENYIVDKATGEAFALDWDFDKMALFLQKAENWKKDIINRDKTEQLMGVDILVPSYQGVRSARVRG
jgi:hypothetical protein